MDAANCLFIQTVDRYTYTCVNDKQLAVYTASLFVTV